MKSRFALLCALGLVPLVAAATASADDLSVGETGFGGDIFIDVSHLDQHINGMRTDTSGTDADLKRFRLHVDHRFSEIWSIHATTDIHWLRHQDPTDLWLRYAYMQGDFSDAFKLRLGSASMPWQGLITKWYGLRYVETDLTMRAKVGNPADWGVHARGTLGENGRVEYAAAVVTGAGYKKPRLGNGPDEAARVAFQPSKHTVIGLGGYRGTLGKDAGSLPHRHTATRWSLMAAFANSRWRLGGQYFRASDWSQVVRLPSDRSHGWSVWASVQLTPVLALFARHDHSSPSRSLDPERRDRYTNAGVEWKARKNVHVAAVFKRERLARDGQHLERDNEAGLYARIQF
jgi:hypothetical protein